MSKLDGGVYIVNPNGLRGDIIPLEHTSKVSSEQQQQQQQTKYVVRLRGSNGTEIPVEDSELVEYTKSHFPEQPATKEEEDVRFHLCQKAEECDEFFLQERMLAMELGDEFTYLLVSDSVEQQEEGHESNDAVLPPEVEGSLFIRLLEAYFVGQGMMVANGRHLSTFSRALRPFWTDDGTGGFSRLSGTSSEEIFAQLNDIFDTAENGTVIFRAFCYSHHRLDYHQHKEEDSLLDAYCVAFYVIKLLQGTIPGKKTDFAALVDRELNAFGSGIEMTMDDLVWCFCILFLRIGTDVRRYKGVRSYNRIFPKPFELSMNEELFACQLAMELRPDSPVSFLPAYRMIIETKTLVPQPFQADWMRTAHDFAERGLESADRLGDPYYQYIFEMIMAYWMPTSINEPNPYTLGQIESRMNLANDLKKECLKIVPKYMFWIGEKHELSLRQMLRAHPIDRDTELTVALMDAFTYTSLHLQPQRKNGVVQQKQSCAHCSKTVERRLQCGRCNDFQYCSKECQVAHWKSGHQNECVPAPCKECGSCSATLHKSLVCSKCVKVGYCSRQCQIRHWKAGHNQICQQTRTTKAA
jgi:hypothetical protein